jgi:phosphoglycolate phosphatase
MNASPPLLVFDLDGTLVDSAADLTATLNVILAREGVRPVPIEQARPMMGLGARVLLQRGFAAQEKPLPPDRLEVLFTDFLAYYEAHIADHSRTYPGVEAALDRFAGAGWRLAVCTNKIEHAAIRLLDELHLLPRFAFVCGQDTFFAEGRALSKPDPRVLELTIERAGGDRTRTVMVGDSRTDIATAQAAGLPVVAVDFGYTDRPVQEFAPDRVISHFNALWDAVAGLELGQLGGAA